LTVIGSAFAVEECRVGGFAADAVMVCSEIIRRESVADNNRRVGGIARGRLGQPYATGAQFLQHRFQLIRPERLDAVALEPGRQCTLAVRRLGAQGGGDLVAVHPGQADVADRQRRTRLARQRDAIGAVIGFRHAAASRRQLRASTVRASSWNRSQVVENPLLFVKLRNYVTPKR
jgi:hypothetical protein